MSLKKQRLFGMWKACENVLRPGDFLDFVAPETTSQKTEKLVSWTHLQWQGPALIHLYCLYYLGRGRGLNAQELSTMFTITTENFL